MLNIKKAKIPIQVYVEAYSSNGLAVHEGLLNRSFWEITHIETNDNICGINVFPRNQLEAAIECMEKLISKANEKNLDWKDYCNKKQEYNTIIKEVIESYTKDFNYEEDYALLNEDEDMQIDYENVPLDDEDLPF